jgi:hypothetical protein
MILTLRYKAAARAREYPGGCPGRLDLALEPGLYEAGVLYDAGPAIRNFEQAANGVADEPGGLVPGKRQREQDRGNFSSRVSRSGCR